MERTHSWKVVCITLDEESEFEDCRQIVEIGYLAPTLRKKSTSVASSMIHSGLSRFHIVDGEEKISLKSAKGPKMYVRTKDDDSSDDPLLTLPEEQDYKTGQRFVDI